MALPAAEGTAGPVAETASPAEGPSASLLLRKPSGEERLLTFSRRPLGIDWEIRLPLVIRSVNAGGAGAQMGVEPGDQLLGCNGETFEGKGAWSCHEALQEAFKVLPVTNLTFGRAASNGYHLLRFSGHSCGPA